MADQNRQRIGNRTPKRSLRAVLGQAIDLFLSAMAILVTERALVKFFKRRQPATDPPREITQRRLGPGETKQQRTGHQMSEINLRLVTWTAIQSDDLGDSGFRDCGRLVQPFQASVCIRERTVANQQSR